MRFFDKYIKKAILTHDSKEFFSVWCYQHRVHALLFVIVIGMTLLIEIKHPYFFVKSDNLDQNLPYYIHNARSILTGEFPLFNFHQYLGTPVFSCVQSAALYVPNYLALFCSWLLLGHYYGAIEFIAIFHLLFAVLGSYHLLRYLGLETCSCCFGAIAWAFCGFVIRVGDGWIQVIEYAAYFPWILLYSLRQIETFDSRAFITLVLLRVFALFIGNPPYFIYTIFFEIITVALLYFTVPKTGLRHVQETSGCLYVRCEGNIFLLKQGLSFVCTFLLAAPLLLPAFYQISQSASRKMQLPWEEYTQASMKLSYWLKGLFIPFSTVQYQSVGELLFLSHIGWPTLFFCFAAVLLVRSERRRIGIFLSLAIFSFLWANNTFVTEFIYSIPILNRQRFPFKLLFFTSFFLIVIGAYGFDALARKFKTTQFNKYMFCGFVLFANTVNLLSLHIATPYDTRKIKNVPYVEPLKNILNKGRIVTIAHQDTADEDKQMYLLGFNFATIFGLYHFAGYETLISEKNSNASLKRNNSADFFIDKDTFFNPSVVDLEYFRKWGVQWYVVDANVLVDQLDVLKMVHADRDRFILRDEYAKPIVFWDDSESDNGIKYSLSTNSISITTDREAAGQLIVNVLYNKFFSATVDGSQSKLSESPDSQIQIVVPAGRHLVNMSYRDPYFTAGIYISIGFILVVLVGNWVFRYKIAAHRVRSS